MEVKLLLPGYKDNFEFYKAFINDDLKDNLKFISNSSVEVEGEIPDFPIYFPRESLSVFLEATYVMANSYLKNNADIFEDELFWHSLLCLYKRDYIIKHFPSVKKDYSQFKRIVIKSFNWENYIYKAMIAAKYVTEYTSNSIEQKRYFQLIYNNLDVFNYIIKYSIFRNKDFLIKVLDIIDEENISERLKKGILDYKIKGKDKRVGREVIYELNKSYPILLSPMLNKEELKKYFLKFLNDYDV